MKNLSEYISEACSIIEARTLKYLKDKQVSKIKISSNPIYVCLFYYEGESYGKVYFMCFIGKDIDKLSDDKRANHNVVYRRSPANTTGEIMEDFIKRVDKKGREFFKSLSWYVSTPYLFGISDKIESSTNTYINNLLKELCNNLNNTFDGYAFLPVTDKKDIVGILKEYCK